MFNMMTQEEREKREAESLQRLRDKITSGKLERATVERMLQEQIDLRDKHQSIYEALTGFERNMYVERAGMRGINSMIKTGEKIIRLMNEMEV